MKKVTLLLFAMLASIWLSDAQTVNQAASWPNAGWTVTGTYTAGGLLSDPTGAGTTFTFDDDAAGNGSSDNIQVASPVIDLTAAHGNGETALTISSDYVYRALGGDVVAIEVYDADALTWSTVQTFTQTSTSTSDYETCTNLVAYSTAEIDISGYTATQLSGFQYRFSYDDQGGWQYGFCITSPTIVSAPPVTCFPITDLTIDSFNASSATISWTENNGATDWEIVVQADGTGEPAGAGTAITSNPHFELGLSGSTAYEVYVRTICGVGDESTWAGPVDFITDPSAPPACPATTTATPDVACGNFNTLLSWDAVIADSYEVTVGTTMGGTDIMNAVDVGNVTSTSVPNQVAGTTYYYTIAPVNIQGTQTGCTEQTYTTLATGCLCESSPTSVDNDGITNVRLDVFDFASPAAPNNLYIDHSGTPVDLAQGVVANCDIDYETGVTYNVEIWIDFNDDLTLDASEIVFSGEETSTASPTTFNADFTVPGAAALGVHKMRIVTTDFQQVPADPCYSGTWGTTIDFDVNIVATACTPATITSATVIENCAAGTFTVDVVVADPGTATFIVGTVPQPIMTGSNILGPFMNDTPQSLTVVDVTDSGCNFDVPGSPFVNGTCPPTPPSGVTCVTGSSSIIFTEEFDAVGGWTGDIGTANDDWILPDTGPTGSSNTGPSGAFSGSNYMSWEASGNNTNSGSVVSPAINLTNAVDGAELAFYMHAYGNNIGILDVGVGTSAAGPFTTEFTWTGEYQTASTDPWSHVGVDLSAYMGQVIYIQFTQTGNGGGDFTGDMSIDLMTVEACGDFCFDPSAIAVSNITSSGAEIAWTNGGSETAWEVAIQAQGTGTPGGSGAAAATNPYSASGLTGETDYEVYVRADCGGGSFSLWTGPVNFTTPCDAITPDYTANMAINVPDGCWQEAGDGEVAAGPTGLGASDWRQDRAYALGASNCLNLWQAVDREWLLSPSFDLSGGTYQLEVNVAVTDYAGSGTTTTADTMGSDDEVQLLISTDGGATWTNLTTWNAGNQPDVAGTEYIEDLSAYTGTVQFAIWGSDGTVDDGNDYDFHVGQFIVRTPPTCGDVSAITVSNVTDSSAQVDWTDAEGETDWEIAVQAAGTGAPGAANDSGTDVTSNTYAATGLTNATAYEVYVRADCSGDGSNLGSWIGPVNFTTLPQGINGVTCVTGSAAYIFSEEFEVVGAWTGDINVGDGGWEIPGDATSGNTGPDSEFSGAADSYMNYEASGNASTTASAVSPAIDLTLAVDDAELSFYMHAYGTAMGTLNVGVGTSAAGPFTTEFTWSGDLQTSATDPWTPVGVDLSAYIGQTIYLEFSHTGSGTSFEGDMSIDYIRVQACGNYCVDPSSVAVSNINGSEVDIAWTVNGGETAWEYAIQPQGTGTPGGAGTAAATNPVTATGLSELTAYEVYVRADCGASTYSGWAGPVNFTTTAACPDVTAITLDSSGATTAQISWTAGGGVLEAGWEIAVQAPGTGAPAGAGTPATNPYSATGLTAETAYEVYVRADCAGDGFSGWSGPLNFTTLCAAITPDYAADMSLNVPDSCWDEAGAGEVAAGPSGFGASDWQNDTDYALGGSNEINLFAGNSDREWLLSPSFDLSADGYELVVNVAVSNWNDGFTADNMGSDDEVQLLMSTDGGASWSNLTTWNAGNQPALAGTEYIEDLTGVTGTDVRFAIFASDGTVDDLEDYDFHVGRFEVRSPLACPDVNTVAVSNIGVTTADIGWINGGSETAWEVAIQAPGTGEPVGSGAAAGSNPYNATGLTENTAYEVYVRANCGGAGFGAWAGPVNFNTACNAYGIPFSETFDSTSTSESCWTVLNENADADAWDLDYTLDTITGDESAALYTDFNGGNNDDWLISPTITLTGNERLVFKYSLQSTTEPNDFEVLLSTTGTTAADFTTTILPLASYNDVDVDLGESTELTIDLSAYSGNVNIAWHVINGGLDGWRLYIDDVLFETLPSCLDVSAINASNITTTSADIGWTNGGSETAWEVAIQAPGTGEPAAADGSGADSATNPYNATGLTAATAYEVWVRAECTAGVDYGTWVGPFNFSTACDTFALPLFEGFESGVPPVCWDSFRGTNGEGSNDWTTTATANTGSGAAFVNWENSGFIQEDWLVSPSMDFSGSTNPELSFYARDAFGADYGSDLTIRVSTTDTDHASFTTVATYTEFNSTIYQELVVDLSAYSADTNVYVAFVWTNDDGDSLYLDDVLIWDNAPGTYTYTDGVWSPFTPSNDLDDIIVASGNLPIDADFTCNTMTVNPGAAVTVDSGNTLTATNGLFMESSSTSYSSLIRNGSITGTIQYVRHVNINGSGTTGSNDLISAPLTGQDFATFAAANPNIFSNGAGTLFLFGPFDKSTGSYVTWSNTETATLDPGVGYRAASDDNGSFTFVGTDNTSDVIMDIQNTGPNNAEWNLIGNPYPAYLNVQDFLLHDVGGVVNIQLFDAPTAAIYGYDGSALNGWTIYNLATTGASTVIAPGQGFFVSADATNAAAYDLEFTPAMRSVGTSDDFISGRSAQLTYLKLSLSSANEGYNTDFYFNANASEGFDLGYDAAIWGETAPAFSIYSKLVQGDAGETLALQALKDTDLANVTIPLGVNANQGEQIVFSIQESTLPANVKVYLDDTVKNTTTLLNDADYTLTPSADLSGTGRFFLRYEEDTLSNIENGLEQLDIYSLKDSDELVVSGQLEDNAMLDLFDIQGRKVLSMELDSALLQNRINVSNINAGIYLVTVISNSQETTKKVIIE